MLGDRFSAWVDRVLPALVLALAFLLPLTRRGVTITSSLLLLFWLLQGRWRQRVTAVRNSGLLLNSVLTIFKSAC